MGHISCPYTRTWYVIHSPISSCLYPIWTMGLVRCRECANACFTFKNFSFLYLWRTTCTCSTHIYTYLLSLFQQIGCDGIVGSDARLDHCGICSGDSSTCQIISGIFTRRYLSYGYNLISRIPAGACNINITEMGRSRNYLGKHQLSCTAYVVRLYYIFPVIVAILKTTFTIFSSNYI